MSAPLLLIVSGLPASGKTTLARWLASEVCLPLISRDDIKEHLFASLGWSDREWSQRLGGASWTLLYWAIETQLAAGNSAVVEANFDPARDSERISALCGRFDCRTVELHCYAYGPVLVERFLARVSSGERHPGHVDDVTIDEFRDRLLAATPTPLSICERSFLVDTTDPASIDYDLIVDRVRAMLAEDT